MNAAPRLLVTGASGRIGRRVRARLTVEGADASYLSSPRSARTGDPAVDIAEITDAEALERVIAARRPAVILHLASLIGAACDADPERTQEVNVGAVESLAEVAGGWGVQRIVLASTSAVYGDQYRVPVSESGMLDLRSAYARSKRAAEVSLAQAVALRPDMSAVALRIFNVYGPGMRDSLPSRLLRATADEPVRLTGMDGFVRDYVHVDDVVDAFVKAATSELSNGWAVANVCTGRPTSNRDLVAALMPVHTIDGEPHSSYSCGDPSAARELLGFRATTVLSRSTVE